MNSSHKRRRIVFAIRNFPSGCGTPQPTIDYHHHHHFVAAPPKLQEAHHNVVAAPKPKEPDHRSDRFRIRNSITPPRSLTTAPKPKEPDHHHHHVAAALKRKEPDHHRHHVAASLKRKEPDHHHSDVVAAHKPKEPYHHHRVVTAPKPKEPNHHSDVVAAHKPKEPYQHSHAVARPKPKTFNHHHVVAPPPKLQEPHPSDRAKVLAVLQLFKDIFKQLEEEKRRGISTGEGSSRIDFRTQAIIEQTGKQVNSHNRIGPVPGIKVGDEFQYKTELRIIGLHFRPWGGIDYMDIRGDVRVATSIVASEGYGYKDKFEDMNVMVYTGEGGNVIKNDEKTENQKMERGNLAMANSVKEKNVVRVIRGEERWDKKGKRYVYYGLYLVDKFWVERDVCGKTSYKFQLSRVPGQPSLT